jgi:hypothetical protein
MCEFSMNNGVFVVLDLRFGISGNPAVIMLLMEIVCAD